MTQSTFRQCPNTRGLRHRLTIWAWILVAVGAMLLLLLILGGVLAFRRNSKRGSLDMRESAPERRHPPPEKSNVLHYNLFGRTIDSPILGTYIPSTHQDPASEPV